MPGLATMHVRIVIMRLVQRTAESIAQYRPEALSMARCGNNEFLQE
jgi:hypothetical protein